MNVIRRLLPLLSFASVALLGPVAAQPASATAGAAAAALSATPQPTELISDLMEMKSTDSETRVVCTGNVVLTGTNLRIACDRLEVIATRIGDKDATIGTLEKFKYLLATGNVRMFQDQREVTCQRAEVLPLEDKVVLTGDPVLIDHSSGFVGAGEEITLKRGEREVIVKQSRVTGPAIKDLGANPTPADTKAGEPAAPAKQ